MAAPEHSDARLVQDVINGWHGVVIKPDEVEAVAEPVQAQQHLAAGQVHARQLRHRPEWLLKVLLKKLPGVVGHLHGRQEDRLRSQAGSVCMGSPLAMGLAACHFTTA
jgi:hypothetical protein